MKRISADWKSAGGEPSDSEANHAQFVIGFVTGVFDIRPVTIGLIGVLLSGIFGIGAGGLSLSWAVRRIETFHLDE